MCTAVGVGSANVISDNAFNIKGGLLCNTNSGELITSLLECDGTGCTMVSQYKNIEVDRSSITAPVSRSAPISNYITKVSTDLIFALYDSTTGLYEKLETQQQLIDDQTEININQSLLLTEYAGNISTLNDTTAAQAVLIAEQTLINTEQGYLIGNQTVLTATQTDQINQQIKMVNDLKGIVYDETEPDVTEKNRLRTAFNWLKSKFTY